METELVEMTSAEREAFRVWKAERERPRQYDQMDAAELEAFHRRVGIPAPRFGREA